MRSPIKLDIAEIARVDLTLQVGTSVQNVTVTSTAPLLQTQDAAQGQVIGGTEVDNLPLNGRNFLQLATLAPGAQAGGTGFFLANNTVRVNGMLAADVSYTVDGVNSTDQLFSGVTLMPPPDAIEQFKVQTNTLDANYGLGGSFVNVQLKSGTNALHGDAWEFLRNDATDAIGSFARSKPVLKQNQFGFVLGGPIKKNRTFFFGDYQGTRIAQGSVVNDVVPTAAMDEGNFAGLPALTNPYTGEAFDQNQITPGLLSSQAAYFLKFIPPPNTSAGTFVDNLPAPNTTNQFDVKIDHQLRTNDSLRVSYSFLRNSATSPGSLPQNGAIYSLVHSQRAGLGWTHSFTPSVVNEFNLGYMRVAYPGSQQGAGTNYTEEAGIGGFEQTSSEFPGFPYLNISGYTGISGNGWRPIRIRENEWVVSDHVTMVKGTHTIDAGFDSRWFAADSYNAALSRGNFSFTGTYTGNGFADFLMGLPYVGGRTFPRNLFGIFNQEQGFYVQDNWKVKPRLSLNLGLRYVLIHPATALHNQSASVDALADQIVVSSNDSGQINTDGQQVTQFLLPKFQDIIVPSSKIGVPASLRYMDYNYLDPRLGLAWQAGKGFVLRMGYGITHSEEEGNANVSQALINPPFLADSLANFNTTPVPTYTLANLFTPITVDNYNLPPLSFYQLDFNRPYNYFQQWNATVQKVIRGGVSVEVAYVGNKGTHVPFNAYSNVPSPGPGDIQSRRQNPGFSAGTLVENVDNTIYNALQMKAETRGWRGLNLIATYTWSKALDYNPQEGPGNPGQSEGPAGPNPATPFAYRGPDPLNLSGRFTLSGVYALPFFKQSTGITQQALGGWKLTSIVTLQSGYPFTPTIATDTANTGTSYLPNRLANGALSNPSVGDWFDASAFSVPDQYTYGNSGMNILTGPHFRNWDFGLFKDFNLSKLREGASLQFRAEFFNFTNTPSFGFPDAGIQDPTVGQIFYTTSSPREVQFALKLYF